MYSCFRLILKLWKNIYTWSSYDTWCINFSWSFFWLWPLLYKLNTPLLNDGYVSVGYSIIKLPFLYKRIMRNKNYRFLSQDHFCMQSKLVFIIIILPFSQTICIDYKNTKEYEKDECQQDVQCQQPQNRPCVQNKIVSFFRRSIRTRWILYKMTDCCIKNDIRCWRWIHIFFFVALDWIEYSDYFPPFK